VIKIICVGKLKEKALSQLVDDYLKRITPYHKIEIVELKDLPSSDDEHLNLKVIEEESNSILKEIKAEDYVVLLDLKGKMLDSLDVSDLIQNCFNQSYKHLVFIIGGSLGVSELVRKRAQQLWKLSDLTFPHGLVRLLLSEQIYRSFRILSNHSYHK
jgi:23S rRNA (pseudouridine1915-N3)-methyltransferase